MTIQVVRHGQALILFMVPLDVAGVVGRKAFGREEREGLQQQGLFFAASLSLFGTIAI
ncbi:MAG: hypothetical protein L3J82_03975 [Planctomycetes bacterium]|nr:hypothetical protein [Planctomycetota bacterium]